MIRREEQREILTGALRTLMREHRIVGYELNDAGDGGFEVRPKLPPVPEFVALDGSALA